MNGAIIILVTMFMIFFGSGKVRAADKLKDCGGHQESNFTGIRQSVPTTQINGLLLVGKKATYQVVTNGGQLKVIGEQSFESGVSKIVCGGGQIGASLFSFSIYAPTLIDLQKDNDSKISFWQFHLTVDNQKFGIWNKKSRLVSHAKENWEEVLERYGIKAQVYQISKSLYEIQFQRQLDSNFEQLIIRYDVASEL